MSAVVTYSHKGDMITVTLTLVVTCPNGDIIGKNPATNELVWIPVEELREIEEV